MLLRKIMLSTTRKPVTREQRAKFKGKRQADSPPALRISPKQAGYALVVAACVYAFLAGFHTIMDPDLGWHMATGRYVLEHHVIPATDVLSYTSYGAPWIYPPLAGILLFLTHSWTGYAGLTWLCALTCLALVAVMVRKPQHLGSLCSAILAVICVPLLAQRMLPRPDLFTHLFFAAFLIILWRFYENGASPKAGAQQHPLWLLPLLMVLWVNIHPGFIAGFAVIGGYLLLEAFELADRSKRAMAAKRLKQTWPVFVATLLATLLNPFGLKIYQASLLLTGAKGHSDPTGFLVRELQPVKLSFAAIRGVLDWRDPGSSFLWAAIAALTAFTLALRRRRFGPAAFLLLAIYVGFQKIRYLGLFAIVVIVIGGSVFEEFFSRRKSPSSEPRSHRRDSLPWQMTVAAVAVFVLSCVRSVDLVTSRPYIIDSQEERFGAGESSQFPERAAAFILREHLPGNIYHPYNLGGFVAFRLGPAYEDFIDGRGLSPEVFREFSEISTSAVDSTEWQTEIDRRRLNVVLLPTGRSPERLADFCRGQLFRPVYLDEVSIVLLRNTPQNRPLLDRLQIDCDTRQFKPPVSASRVDLSNFLANAGAVEFALGRTSEAEAALQESERLTPDDPTVHLGMAEVYQTQQPIRAEEELNAAISLVRDAEPAWEKLGKFYFRQGRYTEAQSALQTAARLAEFPASDLAHLGQIDLALQEPDRALSDFSRAETAARRVGEDEKENPEMFAAIAAGQAMVYFDARDWKRAIAYQQEATRDTPDSSQMWQSLADICQAAGELELAAQARARVSALTNSQ
jgi:tetratricopeptide (TPR) repeat protein